MDGGSAVSPEAIHVMPTATHSNHHLPPQQSQGQWAEHITSGTHPQGSLSSMWWQNIMKRVPLRVGSAHNNAAPTRDLSDIPSGGRAGSQRASVASVGMSVASDPAHERRLSNLSNVGKLFRGTEGEDGTRLIRFYASEGARGGGEDLPDNTVRTSRYTVLNMVPKNLFEQFKRAANFWFLWISILQLLPQELSPTNKWATIMPLSVVIFITMCKDAIEDHRRALNDRSVNNFPVQKIDPYLKESKIVKWKHLKVGDIVVLESEQDVPADIVVLATSGDEGECYVETAMLDGETNLKLKHAVELTKNDNQIRLIAALRGFIKCELPNKRLDSFSGTIGKDEFPRVEPIEQKNFVLKGSKIRNTKWLYGAVVYTGSDTRMMQNSKAAPSKRSRIERQTNYLLAIIFSVLLTACIVSVILALSFPLGEKVETFFAGRQMDYADKIWMIVTFIILYNNMVPISLYVTIDIVKGIQAILIERDPNMFYESEKLAATGAKARTVNLNDDLGQIEYVFSDKTGTITQNEMQFVLCSINGTTYGDESLMQDTSLPTIEALSDEYQAEETAGDDPPDAPMAMPNPDKHVHTTPSAHTDHQHQYQRKTPSPPSVGTRGSIIRTIRTSTGQAVTRDIVAPSPSPQTHAGRRIQRRMSTKSDKTVMDSSSQKTFAVDPALGGAAGGCPGSSQKSIQRSPSSPPPSASKSAPEYAVVRACFTEQHTRSNWASYKTDGTHTSNRESDLGGTTVTVNMYPRKQSVFADAFLKQDLAAGGNQAHYIDEFLRCMALCHTVVPEKNESGTMKYQSASPDEEALVLSAKDIGYELVARTSTGMVLTIMGRTVSFEQVGVNEFSSTRRRMSVIVRELREDGSDTDEGATLYCKGADSVMLSRLAPGQDTSTVAKHLQRFSINGLRTLVLARRVLTQQEYVMFRRQYLEAKTTLIDRNVRLEQVAERWESRLELLGATAIEDRIQEGVVETIRALLYGGVKVWMLTGDKQETAINIGHSCGLLETDTTIIYITIPKPEDKNKNKNKETTEEETPPKPEKSKEKSEKDKAKEAMMGYYEDCIETLKNPQLSRHLAVVVDGETLYKIFDDSEIKGMFLGVTLRAHTVIACRVAPAQKAGLVHLVKSCVRRQPMILAIGDGANDVSMIQEADVGVGIIGNEGMQAVRASDYAIAQFRFLQHLLFLHGRRNYNRISAIILYSFFKNICLVIQNFFFFFNNGHSGTTLFESWLLLSYNLIWTSLPIFVHGFIERDLPQDVCMRFPILYVQGQHRLSFNARIFTEWALRGVLYGFINSVVMWMAFRRDAYAIDASGQPADYYAMGTISFFTTIVIVTVKLAFETRHWTWLFTVVTVISVVFFFPFLAVYAAIGWPEPQMGGMAEAVFGSSTFWFAAILSCGTCFLIDFATYYVRRYLFPSPVDLLDTWLFRSRGHYVDDEATLEEVCYRAEVDANPHRNIYRRIVMKDHHKRPDRPSLDSEDPKNPASYVDSKLSIFWLTFHDQHTERRFQYQNTLSCLRALRLSVLIISAVILIYALLHFIYFYEEGEQDFDDCHSDDRRLLTANGTLQAGNQGKTRVRLGEDYDESHGDDSQDVLSLGRVWLLFVPLLGPAAYSLTFSRFMQRYCAHVMVAVVVVADFVKMFMDAVQRTDGVQFAAMYPIGTFVVFRIPFKHAVWINALHLFLFSVRYTAGAWIFDVEVPTHSQDLPKMVMFRRNLYTMCDYWPVLFGITFFTAFVGYRLEYYQRSEFLLDQQFARERRRQKDILNNMLPSFVVDKIVHTKGDWKNERKNVAQEWQAVSVVFCDIYDFISIVAAVEPITLVTILDRLFTHFDRLSDRFRVAKIETVSETYLAAAGLNTEEGGESVTSEEAARDAVSALKLAIAMLDSTSKMLVDLKKQTQGGDGATTERRPLQVKIGIHTGRVISGVVGSRKPQYALFGDTVNTASRMKSTGEPQHVHISDATYALVQDNSHFVWEPRKTQVKGKGIMDTYLLVDYDQEHLLGAVMRGLPGQTRMAKGSLSQAQQGGVALDSAIPEKANALQKNLLKMMKSADNVEETRDTSMTPNTSTAPAPPAITYTNPPGGQQPGASGGGGEDRRRRSSKTVKGLPADTSGALDAGEEGRFMLDRKELSWFLVFHQKDREMRYLDSILFNKYVFINMERALRIWIVAYLLQTLELRFIPQPHMALADTDKQECEPTYDRQIDYSMLLLGRSTLIVIFLSLWLTLRNRESPIWQGALTGRNSVRLIYAATFGYFTGALISTFQPGWIYAGPIPPSLCHKSGLFVNTIDLFFWQAILNFNSQMLFHRLIPFNLAIVVVYSAYALHINLRNLMPLVSEDAPQCACDLGKEVACQCILSKAIACEAVKAIEPILMVVAFMFLIGASVYFKEYFQRVTFVLNEEANEVEQRANLLLQDMLPPQVLAEMKVDSLQLAHGYDQMTFLFADICGFTSYAKTVPPERVVELLLQLFDRFDDITRETKLYKVCTIGDAYVAVSEPVKAQDHDVLGGALKVLRMAHKMIRHIQDVREKLKIPDLNMRIGSHLGYFVGGIIGTKKLRYDIWGLDVLTGNMMESNGEPGKICVSHTLKAYLSEHCKDRFTFKQHKLVTVVEKVQVQSYLLTDSEDTTTHFAPSSDSKTHTKLMSAIDKVRSQHRREAREKAARRRGSQVSTWPRRRGSQASTSMSHLTGIPATRQGSGGDVMSDVLPAISSAIFTSMPHVDRRPSMPPINDGTHKPQYQQHLSPAEAPPTRLTHGPPFPSDEGPPINRPRRSSREHRREQNGFPPPHPQPHTHTHAEDIPTVNRARMRHSVDAVPPVSAVRPPPPPRRSSAPSPAPHSPMSAHRSMAVRVAAVAGDSVQHDVVPADEADEDNDDENFTS
ncbi:unnamed protein product [Vitrella brassicaformis CCMP3155]|uniref:P-type phospholipid transporter n=4 Tax=Vitrella brassicaformis TaxID=1169539 RepID=A0A0G4ENB6_VITBC|nr:unnamed protein product [Vitrella brassicaformis CCMP3155]|eukprot:CEL99327.1 unnamed protein product [Vitrella brassicaformis CCMP3155]